MKADLTKKSRRLTAALLTALLCFSLLLSACSSGSAIAGDYPYDLDGYMTVAELTQVRVSASETEAAVEKRIAELLWDNDLTERLYDVQAERYDKVVIDHICFIDGLPIDAFGGTAVTAYLGSGSFVDGIEEGIIGMSIGDTKEVTVTFPEKYYDGLEGKQATYRITLNEIHRPKELNDAMCKAYTSYSTVTALRDALKKLSASEIAWAQLLESAEVKEYPKAEYNEIYDGLMTVCDYVSEQGIPLEVFISEYGDSFSEFGITSDMTVDEFYEACEQYAKAQVKQELFLHYVVRKLDVPTKGSAYKTMCARLLRESGCENADKYDEKNSVGSFEYDVLYNLALDALYEHIELI